MKLVSTTHGSDAQHSNIMAAKAVAEAVRTTLGPKGMDKMLVDSLGDVVITNDGATILKEMDIEHPGAKMIVEVAKTQDAEVGDGTTTAAVLAGELLTKAEDLLESGVHPTIIANGYRLAADQAIKIIDTITISASPEDTETLKKIAATAITGKGAEAHKEHLSSLAVKAVTSVAERSEDGKITVDIEDVKVEKRPGGSIKDSEIVEGVIIVENAKVLLLSVPIELKKTETKAEIKITTPDQMQLFLDQEEAMLREIVDKVINTGANVVFCQKGIDDLAQY